jgi:hypothetical protein
MAPSPAPAATAFGPRGPLSERLLQVLGSAPTGVADAELAAAADTALGTGADVLRNDDVQLTLFVLYGLHYGGVIACDDRWEWSAPLIELRTMLEDAFERQLRRQVAVTPLEHPTRETVARALFELASIDQGPGLARFVAREATAEQLVEFLIQRSVYNLKEADPHSWAIPRLTGRAKVALVEIQADEYGGGRPERMHSAIFAGTMRALGLDPAYAAYVDRVPALTLASFNMMSMFGINRRLRGAIVGHLAAFEMTSSIPNRFYGNGFRRLGFDRDVTWYFDEHVEADAVHEQIAARDLAGSLAEDEPELLADILFGAGACLAVDGLVAQQMFDAWTSGRSSLVPVAGSPGA